QALSERMLSDGIEGSFASGGITGMLVDMLNKGLFRNLLDVQCFDRAAVESIRQDDRHIEISASRYASPEAKTNVAQQLDVVILGATEIDLDFNVNVHTDSNGVIMGGSGGHSDTAAGAFMSMIVAPLFRARLPLIVDRVGCISTPGKDVDVLLTQYGLAVNPRREDLRARFLSAGLPLFEIEELKARAEQICGVPQSINRKDRTVAIVRSRDGEILDQIYELAP
ncbi:MAG: citrate lyase subunit alpha, partial [Eubacteriales bacterium]|nr:citrate lyase subunit alpha [Eubacteriales bacterium]